MTTLTHYDNHTFTPPLPITLPTNLTPHELALLLPASTIFTTANTFNTIPAYSFPALSSWLTKLLHNLSLQSNPTHPFHKHPYKLHSLEIQAVDWFWRGRPGVEDKLGFMKLQARIETDAYVHEGEEKERRDWLPGAVFLRGGSVGVLMIVQPADATGEDEKHVILTVQPRIAAASLSFVEIPAGMLDAGSLKGTAASEMEEEACLRVAEHDLVNLSELALQNESSIASSPSVISERVEAATYPSPGATDEYLPLFLCQKRLTRAHMDWLKGKATGLRDEGESITLKLVPLRRVWREAGRDGKALAALALYEGLKGEGLVPGMPEEVEREPEELGNV